MLKLDFDRATLPRDLSTRITMLTHTQGWRLVLRADTRTEHGWHVELGLTGRIALWRLLYAQALLGSDWRREMYNFRRLRLAARVDSFWARRINVLYKRHYRGIVI